MSTISGRPVAFIHVTDRARGLDYYCETLGIPLHSSDDHGDFLEVGGVLLRLTALSDHQAHPHPVFGWDVADIDVAAQALRDRGVTFTIYEGLGQDADGIWRAPDGAVKVAWFADPDGNVLSLSQT
jgi:hypothetical protein